MNSLDVYLIISLAFVFLALVEMALVIIAKKVSQILIKQSKISRPILIMPSETPRQESNITTGSNNITSIDIDCERPQLWGPRQTQSKNNENVVFNTNGTKRATIIQTIFKELSTTNELDFLAFIVFNFAYLVFNVTYFSKLLNTSN